jgi:hypothetical protein
MTARAAKAAAAAPKSISPPTIQPAKTNALRSAFRHPRQNALPASKTAVNRGVQLLRMGWYRPVHAKSADAQEVRALLVGRKLL